MGMDTAQSPEENGDGDAQRERIDGEVNPEGESEQADSLSAAALHPLGRRRRRRRIALLLVLAMVLGIGALLFAILSGALSENE